MSAINALVLKFVDISNDVATNPLTSVIAACEVISKLLLGLSEWRTTAPLRLQSPGLIPLQILVSSIGKTREIVRFSAGFEPEGKCGISIEILLLVILIKILSPKI